ncbi:hypothetical protein EAG14_03975 [Acidovorax sp. 1608163]|nr:hypothetical protein EAG14_03975 [Acidovorax sp. 1608163]
MGQPIHPALRGGRLLPPAPQAAPHHDHRVAPANSPLSRLRRFLPSGDAPGGPAKPVPRVHWHLPRRFRRLRARFKPSASL